MPTFKYNKYKQKSKSHSPFAMVVWIAGELTWINIRTGSFTVCLIGLAAVVDTQFNKYI